MVQEIPSLICARSSFYLKRSGAYPSLSANVEPNTGARMRHQPPGNSHSQHTTPSALFHSKNIFYFKTPGDLLDFEGQIGGSNRDLVRRIQIYIDFPPVTP
jgi:hypothetical protein